LAFGTTAPVASVTVPFNAAVDCAVVVLQSPAKSMTRSKKCEQTFRASDELFISAAIILFLQVELYFSRRQSRLGATKVRLLTAYLASLKRARFEAFEPNG